MPRYLIDRVWEPMDEEALRDRGAASKRLIEGEFTDLVWERSHVVVTDDGMTHSFCIYQAPDAERVRDHSAVLGAHRIEHIYEIAGDVSPLDYPD